MRACPHSVMQAHRLQRGKMPPHPTQANSAVILARCTGWPAASARGKIAVSTAVTASPARTVTVPAHAPAPAPAPAAESVAAAPVSAAATTLERITEALVAVAPNASRDPHAPFLDQVRVRPSPTPLTCQFSLSTARSTCVRSPEHVSVVYLLIGLLTGVEILAREYSTKNHLVARPHLLHLSRSLSRPARRRLSGHATATSAPPRCPAGPRAGTGCTACRLCRSLANASRSRVCPRRRGLRKGTRTLNAGVIADQFWTRVPLLWIPPCTC